MQIEDENTNARSSPEAVPPKFYNGKYIVTADGRI